MSNLAGTLVQAHAKVNLGKICEKPLKYNALTI